MDSVSCFIIIIIMIILPFIKVSTWGNKMSLKYYKVHLDLNRLLCLQNSSFWFTDRFEHFYYIWRSKGLFVQEVQGVQTQTWCCKRLQSERLFVTHISYIFGRVFSRSVPGARTCQKLLKGGSGSSESNLIPVNIAALWDWRAASSLHVFHRRRKEALCWNAERLLSVQLSHTHTHTHFMTVCSCQTLFHTVLPIHNNPFIVLTALQYSLLWSHFLCICYEENLYIYRKNHIYAALIALWE